MTDDEYKFLEVFYKRLAVPEQSLVNYLNGSLPESIENKKEYIDNLFVKFKEFGFIDASDSGVFKITDLGKEKYEEINERKEINKQLENLHSRRFRFNLGGKFWVAIIILVVLISIMTNLVIVHWEKIRQLVEKLMK
ncbi:MAG: hypothetical protein ACHQET_01690 [Chitinophagales bacterium]